MININFQQYLTRTLPYHKRQPNRLKLFYWPFIALQELFDAFVEWRTDVYYRLNITGQILSLQSFLNKRIAGANNSILVRGYNDAGIWAQVTTEDGDAYRVDASLLAEASHSANVAMEGEVIQAADIDFYVYIPAAVNSYEVEKWVNNYKIAGKRYEIIQA